jgi:hypothetical protein
MVKESGGIGKVDYDEFAEAFVKATQAAFQALYSYHRI